MEKIENLTLKEKIGQLFMVGLQENREKEIAKLIKENKIGGVVLYRRNYENYDGMIKLINYIKETNGQNKIPVFVSIDQEGGRVNRIPDEVTNLKCAYKIAATKDIELVKESGKITAQMLNKLGISMNYAPLLDIKRFENNHPIGDRCYGNNKADVSKYGIAVMKEMQKEDVIPVIKHFPGHGSTRKDSHFKIAKITQSLERLENEDMVPFENAIKQGADAIMVGHLIVQKIDRWYPASLSKKVIKKYLIEKNNFNGLIITDDLKMMAIRLHYNMKYAVIRAIEAGNDIIMVGLPYKNIQKLIKYIETQVKTGRIKEERINESVNKIIKMKEKYHVNDNEIQGFNIKEMNNRIEKINEQIV